MKTIQRNQQQNEKKNRSMACCAKVKKSTENPEQTNQKSEEGVIK